MSGYLIAGALAAAAGATLFFSTLTYSLRDFLRPRLQERLDRLGRGGWFELITDNAADLIFITAVARLFANLAVLLLTLRLFELVQVGHGVQYAAAIVLAGVVTLFASVAIPNAAAKYAAELCIAWCAPLLNAMRVAFSPVTRVAHWTDNLFRHAAGASQSPAPTQIDDEILSVVEEGEKEGVVDEEEREMIVSVIQFRDTTAGQIMTARPDIVAIELPATLDDVKRTIETSGHSRIPVYRESPDQIVGILYARDLLQYVGVPPEKFDITSVVRPTFFVPETKPLRDLLQDFRLQKIHMAIVLDEYGGVAGLVTIEDVLEELVGDISDEHEPQEPAILKRISDQVWEADARVYLDELNRTVGVELPEDQGYDTLGGFLTTTLGRIPAAGVGVEHNGAKYTVLSAEPQKINRVRIELSVATPGAS